MHKSGEITSELLDFALDGFGKPNPRAIEFLIDFAVTKKSTQDLEEWLVDTLQVQKNPTVLIKPALLSICGLRDFVKWIRVMGYLEIAAPNEFKKMANLNLQQCNWVDAWLSKSCGADMTKWKGKEAALSGLDLKELLDFAKKIIKSGSKVGIESVNVGQTQYLVKNLLLKGDEDLFIQWSNEWILPAINRHIKHLYIDRRSPGAEAMVKNSESSRFFKNLFVDDMSSNDVLSVINNVIIKIEEYKSIWSKEAFATNEEANRSPILAIVNHTWFDVFKQILKVGADPSHWLAVLEKESEQNVYAKRYFLNFKKLMDGTIRNHMDDGGVGLAVSWWQRKMLLDSTNTSKLDIGKATVSVL